MGDLPRYHSHITRSSTLTTMQAFRTSLAASTRRAFVAPRAPIAASFSTSARFQKDATSTVKETAEAVNQTVGQGILKGVIEPAEKAADAVKSAAGVASNTLGETVGEAVEDASYDAEAAKNIGAKKVNQ